MAVGVALPVAVVRRVAVACTAGGRVRIGGVVACSVEAGGRPGGEVGSSSGVGVIVGTVWAYARLMAAGDSERAALRATTSRKTASRIIRLRSLDIALSPSGPLLIGDANGQISHQLSGKVEPRAGHRCRRGDRVEQPAAGRQCEVHGIVARRGAGLAEEAQLVDVRAVLLPGDRPDVVAVDALDRFSRLQDEEILEKGEPIQVAL